MDEPTPPKPSKFFDVVPADQVKPSINSRPVIVGNKSEQVDPMVTAPQPSQPAPAVTLEEATAETPSVESSPSIKLREAAELPAQIIPTPAITVVHHTDVSIWQKRLLAIAIIVLVVVMIDLIYDVGLLKSNIWHTHLFS